MGKPTGFIEFGRELPTRRPVPVRLRDWKEVYEPFQSDRLQTQASRCMELQSIRRYLEVAGREISPLGTLFEVALL